MVILKIEQWLGRIKNIDMLINAENDFLQTTQKRIAECEKIKAEVSECIAKIEKPMYKTILTEYYLNSKTWEEIAEMLNYEISNIYKLRKKALAAAEKIVEGD